MRCKPSFVVATVFLLISTAATAAVPSPDTAGHLDVGGSKIYYESFGEAGSGKRPVLVLIHDGVAHREVWDAQIAAFATDQRVVRYDRRGYGRSEPARQPFSNVEDLSSLLDPSGRRPHPGAVFHTHPSGDPAPSAATSEPVGPWPHPVPGPCPRGL